MEILAGWSWDGNLAGGIVCETTPWVDCGFPEYVLFLGTYREKKNTLFAVPDLPAPLAVACCEIPLCLYCVCMV
jgi:hypothetical protein